MSLAPNTHPWVDAKFDEFRADGKHRQQLLHVTQAESALPFPKPYSDAEILGALSVWLLSSASYRQRTRTKTWTTLSTVTVAEAEEAAALLEDVADSEPHTIPYILSTYNLHPLGADRLRFCFGAEPVVIEYDAPFVQNLLDILRQHGWKIAGTAGLVWAFTYVVIAGLSQ